MDKLSYANVIWGLLFLWMVQKIYTGMNDAEVIDRSTHGFPREMKDVSIDLQAKPSFINKGPYAHEA